MNSVFVYNHYHVILNSHAFEGVEKLRLNPVAEIHVISMPMRMMYSWLKITDFSLFLKNIVPFCLFSCIYSILKT